VAILLVVIAATMPIAAVEATASADRGIAITDVVALTMTMVEVEVVVEATATPALVPTAMEGTAGQGGAAVNLTAVEEGTAVEDQVVIPVVEAPEEGMTMVEVEEDPVTSALENAWKGSDQILSKAVVKVVAVEADTVVEV
jgi:hypothetical protein